MEAWRVIGVPLGISPSMPLQTEPPDWTEMPDGFFLESLGYEGLDLPDFAFSLAEARTREEVAGARARPRSPPAARARPPSPPQRARSPSTASESSQGLREF